MASAHRYIFQFSGGQIYHVAIPIGNKFFLTCLGDFRCGRYDACPTKDILIFLPEPHVAADDAVGEGEEAQAGQSVVKGHHHHLLLNQGAGVVLSSGPFDEAAAVEPDHDRFQCGPVGGAAAGAGGHWQCRGINVEVETVLRAGKPAGCRPKERNLGAWGLELECVCSQGGCQ